MLTVAPKVQVEQDALAARHRLGEAIALQAIEGNPLNDGEIAMFEMFEREGWSHQRRRAHILSLTR